MKYFADNDDLILDMIMDAWLTGDKEKALELSDHWMHELTPQDEAELRYIYGNDYDELFGEHRREVMQ